ncbi:MAG: bifunctional acetate--CoA ligase family protein/GNAT family N-acetyltransferase [Betaproteobacteria bacterium]|nr:bifunctional acetate--CoA ligase family protein/GNAT family N-acetyltransferase [Betaproteobacteria bacterium]
MSIKLRNRLAANRFRIPDAGAVPSAAGISKLIHPLHPLLSPASVALVGASARPGSLGQVVLANLRQGGFRGPIHLVNPRHTQLDGVACHPTLEALPEAVDLAIVTAPAVAIPEIIAQAGRAGIPAAIVLSAGFGETGEAGKALEAQVLAVAQAADVRILGPNCVGMLRPSIGLNASFARTACEPGSIALVSQSGAICTALVDWAASTKVGLSSVVSLGAAVDVDFGDVLDYLLFDPKTESVLLYVEGVHNGRTFISSLRAIARAKPVIVLKVGRYASGSQAARSHTGALVGNDAVFDAVLTRCGVVRVHSAQDLFAAARALSSRRKPYGDRLAVVTNGGGPGVLAADACSSENVQLAKLAPDTLEKLNAILPKHWSHGNPVDVIGDANGERFGGAAKIVAEDPNVDAVLTVFCPTGIASAESVADGLLPVAKECSKPFLTAWLGESGVVATRHRVEEAGVPAYRAGEVAVQAFAALATHVKNQKLLLESPPPRSTQIEHDIPRAEEIFRVAVDEGRTLLNEVEAKSLLAAFGVPVPPFAVAATREEALQAAGTIGYPVVMKILSPDISHKSDVNGVRLDIRDANDVGQQFDDIIATVKRMRPEAKIAGVLVQAMVVRRDGRELMIGVMTDPAFGPAISFGSGGVAVELLRDNAVGLPPLNLRLAGDLVDRTRAARLLGAYRNVPAANRAALLDVLLRVSDLVCALPWVAEMDINPLLLDPSGAIALDARVVIDPERRHLDSRYSHLAIHPYPEALEAVERLRDGTEVTIRPIRPEDAEMETAFITELSDESRYLRFLSLVRHVTPEMVARFTQIDYDREMALIAVRHEGDRESIIGVARYVRDPNPASAEFAIVIADRVQRKGLASKLMGRLMTHARFAGIERLRGLVLASNGSMLDLMDRLGFEAFQIPDDPSLVDVIKVL